ncbi:MAG: metallophosphoesterase [Planctomycetota bacterium]|jgi:predicted phosphodiesterase|nr:metallophosphoesterase [Planctomycetota bacterium]
MLHDYRRVMLGTGFTLAVLLSAQAGEPVKILKGPYLHRPLPAAMTIMWETDVPTDSCVEYGPTRELGEELSRRSEPRRLPRTEARVHAVEVTGLKPATKYFYRVRSRVLTASASSSEPPRQEAVSEVRTFRTAPADANASVRMAVYGDNRSWPNAHRRVVDLIRGHKPDLIAHTGDFVAAYGSYYEWQWMFFDVVKDLIAEVPMYGAVGNHERETDYFHQFFVPHYANNWYPFDYGPVHGAVLDTAGGHPTEEQLGWLESDLAASKAPWKFVFLHRPLISADHRFNKICSEQGVSIVFFGHEHLYERTRPLNGVVYVITGGGGAPAALVPWGDRRPWQSYTAARRCTFHATILEVDSQRVRLRAIDTQGKTFDSLELRRNVKPGPAGVFLPEVTKISDTLSGRFPVDLKPGESTRVSMDFTNSLPRPLTLKVKCDDFYARRWRVEPGEAEVRVEPGQEASLPFTVTRLGEQQIPTAFLFGSLIYEGQKVGRPVRVIAGASHRSLKARRAQPPPTMDGKLDDLCWKASEVASGFVQRFGHAAVSQQTRVRVCYDAEHLYLAYDCDEERMKETYAHIQLPENRPYNDDNAGVFFSFPEASDRPLYVMTSCIGVTFLGGRVKGERWAPACKVGTVRGDKGWTLEMAIPLKDLPPGKIAPGDVWPVNLMRHRYPLPMEFSTWSCPYGQEWAWESNLGKLVFVE